MQEEIWKPIPGYEGLYEASNKGRVKSIERVVVRNDGRKRTVKERILKGSPDKAGYLLVTLHDGKSEQRTYPTHRLIGFTFLEPVEGKNEINHIDENKVNNAVWNLEWCTREENNNYGTRTERSAKTQSKSVAQLTKDGKLVKVWLSTREAERQLGLKHGNISNAALGKQQTAYNYVWKYVEENQIENMC